MVQRFDPDLPTQERLRIGRRSAMSFELLYTSVPKGLRAGSKGFCTVGLTRGTPATLVERLESISDYRPVYSVGSPRMQDNPVKWMHSRIAVGTQTLSVLSRVCFAGVDYSQRSNLFAHHVALRAGEQAAGGPAWMLAQPGFMATSWSGQPAEYEQRPTVPVGNGSAGRCDAWAAATGDAGWAGVLAESVGGNSPRSVCILFNPGVDLLPLMAEALTLVPESRRWKVTFNTYFTGLAAGSTCDWRCCVSGSPAAEEARRAAGLVIDLTALPAPAAGGPLVQIARTGVSVAAPMTAAPLIDEGPGFLDESDDDATDGTPVNAPYGVPYSASQPARPTGRVAVLPVMKPRQESGDWMPPVAATLVEPMTRTRRQAATPGPGWLAVAAIAAFVGVVVFLVMTRHEQHAIQDALTPLLNEKSDMAAADVALREKVSTLETTNTLLAREKSDLLNRKANLEGQVSALTRQLESKSHEPPPTTPPPEPTPATTRDVAATKPAQPADPVAPTTGDNSPPSVTDVQWKDFGVANYHWVDLQHVLKQGRDVRIGKFEPQNAGSGPELKIFATANDAGKFTFTVQTAPYSAIVTLNTQGAIDSKPQTAAFAFEGDTLIFRWRRTPDATEKSELEEYLRTALLTVGNVRVQFLQPQATSLDLASQFVQPKVPPGRQVPNAWRLKEFVTPQGWAATALSPTQLQFAHGSDTMFVVGVGAARLDCGFAKKYETAAIKVKKAGADLDAADPANKAVRDEKIQAKAVSDKSLADLTSFDKGHILLELENGVVLSEITMSFGR